jgi:diguanylate cyclase (GGDEF)-like protein
VDYTVLIILAGMAAGAALIGLLAVVFGLARRSARKAAQGEVDSVVAQLTARMDELAGDLQRALARAESEGRRSRFLGELSASIDLDDVLSRTLDAASGVPAADAALVTAEGGADPDPIVAAAGMAVTDAERQAFAHPPDGQADAVEISYRYADGGEGRVQSALAVPLAGETEQVGWLAVYSNARRDDLDDAAVELEDVAHRAGPAIANALRFRDVRRLADLDALTGLHNRRYFHETLAREVARAHRYGRRLSLVVLDLDDFKGINERIGHLAGDGVIAEAADRMRSAVRTSDISCRVGGDEFAVILPESGLGQADQLYRRVLAATTARPIGQLARLSVSAGVVELTEDDDATSLFERADAALYRAKAAGKARAFPAAVPEPPAESNSA